MSERDSLFIFRLSAENKRHKNYCASSASFLHLLQWEEEPSSYCVHLKWLAGRHPAQLILPALFEPMGSRLNAVSLARKETVHAADAMFIPPLLRYAKETGKLLTFSCRRRERCLISLDLVIHVQAALRKALSPMLRSCSCSKRYTKAS